MAEDPLNTVYAYAERAYVRLQAGDLLIRCIEEGSPAPMQQMVEGLVLAGPQSLSALQEMLAVTGQQKSQAMDDIHQVFAEFENNLKKYGVRLKGIKTPLALARLSPVRFLKILRDQQIADEKMQIACMQLLKDSREVMRSLAAHLQLLEDIETYLQDWMWGLAYQSARQGDQSERPAH